MMSATSTWRFVKLSLFLSYEISREMNTVENKTKHLPSGHLKFLFFYAQIDH